MRFFCKKNGQNLVAYSIYVILVLSFNLSTEMKNATGKNEQFELSLKRDLLSGYQSKFRGSPFFFTFFPRLCHTRCDRCVSLRLDVRLDIRSI